MNRRRPSTATAIVRVAFSLLLAVAVVAVLRAARSDATDPINPDVAGLPAGVVGALIAVGVGAVAFAGWSVIEWSRERRRARRPSVLVVTPRDASDATGLGTAA